MPATRGCRLLLHAAEAEDEDKLFARWVAGPQFDTSFGDFKKSLEGPKFRPDKELMEDIANIMGGVSNGNI